MKIQQTFLLIAALGAATIAVTLVIWMLLSSQDPKSQQTITTEPSTEQTIASESTNTYPLYFTTMTHMEGNWDFVLETEHAFNVQVQRVQYGMDLAEEYGAVLTIETEEPFARADAKWNRNFMREVVDRGHGVGTHCDRQAKGDLSYRELVDELKMLKSLVDDLVGAESNKGCSGTGGPEDWAQAMTEAGFSYVNGLVGFHMLAFPLSERPVGWSDRAISEMFYHDNVPVDLEERIHLFRLKNTANWEPDETGIVVSSGEMGRLTFLAEGDREACLRSSCPLDADDVQAVVDVILQAAELHDPSRVAKLAVHIPTDDFLPENEEALRLFFAELQRLEEEGVIKWASQLEVYEAHLNWEQEQQ